MPLSDPDFLNSGVQHPNPLHDYLTTFVPRKLKSLFTYCEYLYCNSPQIFAALCKFAVYPVTDIIYNTDNQRLKQDYKTLHEKGIDLKAKLIVTGIDRHVYGNSFLSIYFPFKRFLKCPRCHNKRNIRHVDYKFKIKKKKLSFSYKCPSCKHVVNGIVDDEKLRHPKDINLIRWDPKHIEIEGNPITGENEYYYDIPEDIKDKVRRGDKHILATTPLSFLDTIAQGKVFKFAKGRVYHMKTEAPAGIDNRWGFPPLTSTIKQFMYTAVLRKANEAISLEHIVPFRVMHPQQSTASADPTITISLSNWLNETKMNLKQWRKDPLHMMFSPIPIGVTNVGGQGRALMVTGEIVEAENAIIAGLGIPREFIYGGLSATGSGVTLRMLENQLMNYTSQLIEEAQWVSDRCAEFLGWKKVSLDLEPFKLVDDVPQKNFLVQANQAAGGTLISNTTLAGLYGVDIDKERDLRKQEIIDEQRFSHDITSKIQKMEQNMADQARAASTMSMPQGYDQQAVIGQADQLVEQMMQMDDGTRKSYLHSLQMEDFVLYSVVIQRWEEFNTQQEAMVRQETDAQQQGGAV